MNADTIGRITQLTGQNSLAFTQSILQPTESEMQGACEQWLLWRGYLRRTPENADLYALKTSRYRGTFAHVNKARGNPQFGDILITNKYGRYIEIELKRKKRKRYQPGQREWIASGAWKEVDDFDQFTRLVEAWERGTI